MKCHVNVHGNDKTRGLVRYAGGTGQSDLGFGLFSGVRSTLHIFQPFTLLFHPFPLVTMVHKYKICITENKNA